MDQQFSPEQLAAMKSENVDALTLGIIITFTCLSLICIVLRFWTRISFINHVGVEDYFIAAAMALSIAMLACQILQVHYGNGHHTMFLSLGQAENILKYLYWSIVCYCAALTCTKVSILLQYRRIFTGRGMRRAIYFVLALCVAYGIESIGTSLFTCIPVEAFWSYISMAPGSYRCIDEHALWYAHGGLNISTDLAIAILPIRPIWKLKMARKQKIALISVMCLGWFTCITSILRLNSLIILARHTEDSTFYSSPTAYWSSIELNLAICCACAPALKPLVVHIFPRFGARDRSFGYSSNFVNVKGSRKPQMDRSSFHELQDKNNPIKDTESGYVIRSSHYSITALPSANRAQRPTSRLAQEIRVQRDFEVSSVPELATWSEEDSLDANSALSASESQKDLVPVSPMPAARK